MSFIILKQRPNQHCFRRQQEYLNYLHQQRQLQESKIEIRTSSNLDVFEVNFCFPFIVSAENLSIQVNEEDEILQVNFVYKGDSREHRKYVKIPEDVDQHKITAKFKGNSLHIQLPRKEYEIPIQVVKKQSEEIRHENEKKIEELKRLFNEEFHKSEEFDKFLKNVLGLKEESKTDAPVNTPTIHQREEVVEQEEPLETKEDEELIIEDAPEMNEETPNAPELSNEPTVETEQEIQSIYPEVSENYKVHLDILRGLGFDREDLIHELLIKHDGNIQAIVNEYLERM